MLTRRQAEAIANAWYNDISVGNPFLDSREMGDEPVDEEAVKAFHLQIRLAVEKAITSALPPEITKALNDEGFFDKQDFVDSHGNRAFCEFWDNRKW